MKIRVHLHTPTQFYTHIYKASIWSLLQCTTIARSRSSSIRIWFPSNLPQNHHSWDKIIETMQELLFVACQKLGGSIQANKMFDVLFSVLSVLFKFKSAFQSCYIHNFPMGTPRSMLPQGTCSPNAQGGHGQNAWRQLAAKLDTLDPLLLPEESPLTTWNGEYCHL